MKIRVSVFILALFAVSSLISCVSTDSPGYDVDKAIQRADRSFYSEYDMGEYRD